MGLIQYHAYFKKMVFMNDSLEICSKIDIAEKPWGYEERI